MTNLKKTAFFISNHRTDRWETFRQSKQANVWNIIYGRLIIKTIWLWSILINITRNAVFKKSCGTVKPVLVAHQDNRWSNKSNIAHNSWRIIKTLFSTQWLCFNRVLSKNIYFYISLQKMAKIARWFLFLQIMLGVSSWWESGFFLLTGRRGAHSVWGVMRCSLRHM